VTSSSVEARGLSKVFTGGIHALDAVDLKVPAGQFVAVLGPSGCGKSTLLRLTAGLEHPSAGSLQVGGLPPLEARRSRRNLAYVFQEATLLPWRTVERNVALPLELLGPEVAPPSLSVGQALQMVGLSPFARAFPWQLSGGMRMRVSIARALITRPGLLLMDEPFAALDALTRQRLNEELLRLWEQDRWTCLFVTHNVQEAVFLSQRVLVMGPRPGRLVADLPVPFAHPRTTDLHTEPAFNRLAAQAARSLQESMR
jgi:NitT/TauT family transport system ATP-binding protein